MKKKYLWVEFNDAWDLFCFKAKLSIQQVFTLIKTKCSLKRGGILELYQCLLKMFTSWQSSWCISCYKKPFIFTRNAKALMLQVLVQCSHFLTLPRRSPDASLLLSDCHRQWSPVVTPASRPTVWGSATTPRWARTWHSCASRATWWSERTRLWRGPAPATAPGVAPCQRAKVSTSARTRARDAHMPQCTVNLDHRQSGAVTTLARSHTIKSTCVCTLLRSNGISGQGDTKL